MRWAGTGLLHLLAPRCCAACANPLPFPRELFCDHCEPAAASALVDHDADLGFPVVALGCYRPPWSLAIRSFKYNSRFDLAGPLARALWQRASISFPPPVVFVPVPMHPKRLCERGYNQAVLLARHLARLSSGAVNVSSLRRTANTTQQARLGRDERTLNLQHTMHTPHWRDSRPAVLVDDVLTTGATLLECARALNQAGARVVGACVIAIAGKEPMGVVLENSEHAAPEPMLGLL